MAALLALLVAGCGSGDKTEQEPATTLESAAAVEVVRGFAIYGHEVRAFRPCGSKDDVWAIDSSGALWEIHQNLAPGREPYEEVFAIVEGKYGPPPEEGFGADYPRALEVMKVLYVAKEGFRCDLDLSAFCYRAYGNEPFWSVWISSEGIVVKMPGYEDRRWTDIEERTTEEGVQFAAKGPSGPLWVRIVDGPCHDTMSGAYFAYAARLQIGDEAFMGCALKGTGQPGNWR
jgi:putative lipoprotein